MAKPVVLTVDDEPQVLNALERDLRQHFRGDYRIVKAGSGSEALEATRRLLERGEPIALFVADQRMPEMSGTEFLSEARKLYPEARKVLLTAYADTEAAITSINTIGLDYYFLKPWHPPEQRLYPVIDDLLGDWLATVSVPYDGIRVAGTQWSAASHVVKDFLARNRVPYQWLDVEKDEVARQLAAGVTDRLPVIFFPDGTVLVEPTTREIAERVGLQTQAKQPFFDLVVVGAGPAGLGAGVYAASEGLRVAMIECDATGGQAGSSSRIENYLGFPSGVSGTDLAQRAATQAMRFGAEILSTQDAVSVRVEDPYRVVVLRDGTELSCHALLVATGMSLRELDVPGIEGLAGAGVYYGAAAAEAAPQRGQHVLIVGGANSAGQGAMFLSRYASKVTVLVRGSSLEKGMSHYLVQQLRATDNIEVVLQSEVTGVRGNGRLEAVSYRRVDTGETFTMNTGAMFVFIGAVPHSELVAGVVERNEAGFILTGPDLPGDGSRPKGWALKRDPFLLETSVPGIFAAGDVRHGAMRRVASAVGEGAIAVTFVHKYLETV